MAFFPLTIPLTTGPGTIATAIAIGTNRTGDVEDMVYSFVTLTVAAIAITAAIYHAYRRSSMMARLFGEAGTSVITRLSAFFLLCIGVEIIIAGVVEVAKTLAK
jgi:multiple antibiotic resistance protein